MIRHRVAAVAAGVALCLPLLAACGGVSQCEAASDYVWLVDYGAGQHGGPPDDEKAAERFASRLLEAIDSLDEDGPEELDDDLDNVRTVWEVSLRAVEDGEPERIATDVEEQVPGGATAAQESGTAVVEWARDTCGDEDSFPEQPDDFDA